MYYIFKFDFYLSLSFVMMNAVLNFYRYFFIQNLIINDAQFVIDSLINLFINIFLLIIVSNLLYLIRSPIILVLCIVFLQALAKEIFSESLPIFFHEKYLIYKIWLLCWVNYNLISCQQDNMHARVILLNFFLILFPLELKFYCLYGFLFVQLFLLYALLNRNLKNL